jgi:hypothetical protein
MLEASMASHVGPRMRQRRHGVKSSVPVNRQGAQHVPVAWPPFTFGRPIGSLVLRLLPMSLLPRLSHVGPQLKVQRRVVKENFHPGEPLWGSARSSHVASSHLWP